MNECRWDDLPRFSEPITPGERRVVACVAEGIKDEEIAKKLHLSLHTVKSHLRNLRQRNGFQNRVQIAVAYVLELMKSAEKKPEGVKQRLLLPHKCEQRTSFISEPRNI